MLHIAERFLIHFFSSAGLVLAAFHLLGWLQRRSRFVPEGWRARLALAGLAVFAVSTLREAYDVHAGQSLLKAVADYLSWLSGTALSVLAISKIIVGRV